MAALISLSLLAMACVIDGEGIIIINLELKLASIDCCGVISFGTEHFKYASFTSSAVCFG